MMIRILIGCALGLVAGTTMAASKDSAAWPASPITDRLAIRGGWMQGSVTTRGRVDDPLTGAPGTEFSAEQDFNQPDEARQLRVELMFRLRERGRVRVDMWDLSRKGTASPAVPIEYGAHSFVATDVVESQTDWRQINITWTYSFLRASRYELGAGVGLHLVQAEGQARVRNRALPVREDFNGAGPFATLALDGTWRFARRWSLSGRAQYFKLKVGSVSGMLGDYHGDIQYRWRPNVALGLGFQSTQVRIEVMDSHPNGLMRMGIAGPELFVRASF
jgi:hypothetical protein